MRSVAWWKLLMLASLASGPTMALAQGPGPAAPEGTTRQGAIEQAQAEKENDLQPFTLSKGERDANKAENIIVNGLTWYPFLENAYQGGGFPFGVGYRRYVSPTTRLTFAAATPSRATSGRKRSSSRHTCSIDAANCRCSAAGVRLPRSASTASVRTRSRRIAPTTRSGSLCRSDTHTAAHPSPLADRRRDRMDRVAAAAGSRVVPFRRLDVYAGDAARPGCGRHVHPLAGDDRLRLAALPRLRAPWWLLRRDRARLH